MKNFIKVILILCTCYACISDDKRRACRKVKSERINAIRKQYDAFLEEDKKRKDRNEYILERLDRMRSSTALVQVPQNQKPNIFSDLNNKIHKKSPQHIIRDTQIFDNQRYPFNRLQAPHMVTALNEEALVKELSKKYILIPKQSFDLNFDNICQSQSKVEEVTDWRSKYNILDELKKHEKEEEVKIKPVPCNKESSEKLYSEPDKDIVNEAYRISGIISSENDTERYSKSQKISPQSSVQCVIDTRNVDITAEVSNKNRNPTEDTQVISLSKTSEVLDSGFICDSFQVPETLTEKEKLQAKYEIDSKPEAEDSSIDNFNTNINSYTDVEQPQQIQELNEPAAQSEKTEHGEIENLETQKNTNIVDDVNYTEIHEDNVDIALKEAIVTEFNSEPADVIKIPESDIHQDFLVESNTKENVPDETVYDEISDSAIEHSNIEQVLQSEVREHVNSQIDTHQYEEDQTISQQEYENPVEETQVQDFDAEQNNVFYPETTEGYAYDQSGETDDVNAEYTTHENYEQNEGYGYYEGAPQEQSYPAEVNKHEESTEQYDPNYQNQYYEQHDTQQNPVQHYETEEYENQQNYEQAPYEETQYNAVEEVEQQLDSEQGFIEPLKSDESNVSKVTTTKPNETTQENQNVEQDAKVH